MKESLAVKIDNCHIGEITKKSISESIKWFESVRKVNLLLQKKKYQKVNIERNCK